VVAQHPERAVRIDGVVAVRSLGEVGALAHGWP
jgi:hypothetical protein